MNCVCVGLHCQSIMQVEFRQAGWYIRRGLGIFYWVPGWANYPTKEKICEYFTYRCIRFPDLKKYIFAQRSDGTLHIGTVGKARHQSAVIYTSTHHPFPAQNLVVRKCEMKLGFFSETCWPSSILCNWREWYIYAQYTSPFLEHSDVFLPFLCLSNPQKSSKVWGKLTQTASLR